MRTHDVPNFSPRPTTSVGAPEKDGQPQRQSLQRLAVSKARLLAAQRACERLLPTGPSPSVLAAPSASRPLLPLAPLFCSPHRRRALELPGERSRHDRHRERLVSADGPRRADAVPRCGPRRPQSRDRRRLRGATCRRRASPARGVSSTDPAPSADHAQRPRRGIVERTPVVGDVSAGTCRAGPARP